MSYFAIFVIAFGPKIPFYCVNGLIRAVAERKFYMLNYMLIDVDKIFHLLLYFLSVSSSMNEMEMMENGGMRSEKSGRLAQRKFQLSNSQTLSHIIVYT